MNCDKFDKNISLYIDNELSDIEKREFELHLMKCEKCRKNYENMINILKIVREDEQEELPEGYREGLRRKLIKTSKEQRKMINWKLMASIAASLLVLLTSYELINNNNVFNLNKSDSSLEMEQSAEMQATGDVVDKPMIMTQEDSTSEVDKNMLQMDQASNQAVENDSNDKNSDESKAVAFRAGSTNIYGIQATRSKAINRKTIKEAHIDIDTDEFDSTSDEIINYVNENNGFVESMEIENKQENISNKSLVKQKIIKIRIPQDKFEQAVCFIKGLGTIKNVQCSISDVTEKYNNVENDLDNFYNKEFRLGEILNKVENIEDIQLIEDEINKVKEQVKNHSDILQKMDDSSTLSTINTILNENTDE